MSTAIEDLGLVTTPPPPHQFPKDMLGLTAASSFIIAILGASGNLLTIFALPMSKKLRTSATAFVVNLAVVELMFCIFILPISGAQYAYLQYYDLSLFSDLDCIFFAVARYTFTQVQLQTIVGIALFRAIAVSCPRLYQKINNPYVTVVYITMIWLYSFSLKLPTGLGVFGSYVFNAETMECDMNNDAASRFARFIAIIVEVLIPVCTIFILYIFIFIMVKKSSFRVARSSFRSKQSSKGSVSGPPTSSSEETATEAEHPVVDDRKFSASGLQTLKKMVTESHLRARFGRRSSSLTQYLKHNRRDMRVARSIFIIYLVTIMCSVPVGVIHFIDSKGSQPRRFLAVHIMYWLQYCINVFVYVLLNRQYRDAYVECLAKFMPGWERHKGFTFPWESPSTTSKKQHGTSNSLGKSNKDSGIQDPTLKKDPQVLEKIPFRQGRLSAIPEANSSSTNDDTFASHDQPPKKSDLNSNQLESQEILGPESVNIHNIHSIAKNHVENGTEDEKQLMVSENYDSTLNSTENHEENTV